MEKRTRVEWRNREGRKGKKRREEGEGQVRMVEERARVEETERGKK